MVVLLSGLHHPRIRALVIRILATVLSLVQRLLRKSPDGAVATATSSIEQIAGLHLSRRDALMAARFAVLNWTADIACLAAALAAVGAPIPWHGLILAWAAGAGASSLGLTPGGLGVVEAALSLALVAAGLPLGLAVSGVLLYRFVKLWLVLAAGVVTLLVIRARAGVGEPPLVDAALDGLDDLGDLDNLDDLGDFDPDPAAPAVPVAHRHHRLPVGDILGASAGVTFPGVTYVISGVDPVVVTTKELPSEGDLVRPCV